MKVYSIEKQKILVTVFGEKLMNQKLINVVSSKLKVNEELFYQGVLNVKYKKEEEWEYNMFPYEFYTKTTKVEDFTFKDIISIKEWELY